MHGTKEADMQTAVTLPAVVDLAAAEALLATLRKAQSAGRPCRVDAAQVEKLMLPGIQVILAAIRGSAKIEVVNPSAAFCAAFEDAALSWMSEGAAEPLASELVVGEPLASE